MPHTDFDEHEDWQDDSWRRDDDSDDGYISCPHCGETMLEDAEYCPACERWMTSEDQSVKRHPWWIIVVALALISMMVLSFLR